MINLGYDITLYHYQQFLKLLEVDIYGGAPSLNFIQLI